ncbi:MAG: MOSC domain-containing protein [Egibacteraceae bacterium]
MELAAEDLRALPRTVRTWWPLALADVDEAARMTRPEGHAASLADLEDRSRRHAEVVAADGEAPGRVAAAEAALVDLAEASALLRALGLAPTAGRGSVEGVHVAPAGGVPKPAVEAAAVGPTGLAGDRQATPRAHGRPWQAVSLWSAEAIERLAAQGHGLFPGAAGENLTVRGLDWPALRPGVRLRLGTATVELTLPCTPCKANARWFADGDPSRMGHDRDPGLTRWYARVVEPGAVAVGDAAVLEP